MTMGSPWVVVPAPPLKERRETPRVVSEHRRDNGCNSLQGRMSRQRLGQWNRSISSPAIDQRLNLFPRQVPMTACTLTPQSEEHLLKQIVGGALVPSHRERCVSHTSAGLDMIAEKEVI